MACSSSTTVQPEPTFSLDRSATTEVDILFAGHIYGYNGNTDAEHYPFPPAPDGDSAVIDAFVELANQMAPDRIVLGGDLIRFATLQSVEYLEELSTRRITSETRLIPGNHDLVFQEDGARKSLEKIMLFESFYEDIGGLRLIYLNSVLFDSTWPGIPPDRLKFLRSALDGDYDIAVLFLHHALWLADLPDEWVNSAYYQLSERFWEQEVLPILTWARVGAVIAGDGGVRQPNLIAYICGIPYYTSGWSFNIEERPAEFLRITYDGDLRVNSGVIGRNEILQGSFKEVPAQDLECEK